MSRSAINQVLMNSAERTGNVKIHFNMKCDKADLADNKLHFNQKIINIDSPVIGADGYKSVISKNIAEINNSK